MRATLASVLAVLPIIACACGAARAGDHHDVPSITAAAIERQLPAHTRVLFSESKQIAEATYTFVKYLTADDAVAVAVFDRYGMRTNEKLLPTALPPALSEGLGRALQRSADPGRRLRVNVGLRVEPDDALEATEWGSADVESPADRRAGRSRPVVLDGEQVDDAALLARAEATRRRIARSAAIERRRAGETLRGLAVRQRWLDRPAVRRAIGRGDPSVVLDLTPAEIERLATREADHIAGIELWETPGADIEDAMRSSRVDPYALDYPGRRGGGIGIYTTDTGCPDPGLIGNYTRLSGTRIRHSDSTTLILRAVSPESWIYCRAGPVPPSAADLQGYGKHPPVYVVSQSYSQYNSPEYTTIDRDTDDFVYKNLVLHVNSAANNGEYVRSPGKGLNVLTVGNYDDDTDTIAPSSSWMDPQTNNMKPELSMPGTNISLGGYVLSGTSAAAPHAAAFTADLMSAHSWYRLRPQLLKAAMLAGASKRIKGGPNRVGVGGGDFQRAVSGGKDYWWAGANGEFATFDAADPRPGNGSIDVFYELRASMAGVRVALVWLTRGTYTFYHRNEPHPIGTDLDLVVYGPDGTRVADSASFDNPFELCVFDPQVTGTYRFSIRRQANRDTASALRMGLKIDW